MHTRSTLDWSQFKIFLVIIDIDRDGEAAFMAILLGRFLDTACFYA